MNLISPSRSAVMRRLGAARLHSSKIEAKGAPFSQAREQDCTFITHV
jgi:hypothetical protein